MNAIIIRIEISEVGHFITIGVDRSFAITSETTEWVNARGHAITIWVSSVIIYDSIVISINHGWVMLASFNKVVNAIIIRIKILEVWTTVSIGINRLVFVTISILIELITIWRRFKSVRKSVCSYWNGEINRTVTIRIEGRNLCWCEATLINVEDTITITIQIKWIRNSVSVSIAIVLSSGELNKVWDAIIVIINVDIIEDAITISISRPSAIDSWLTIVAITIGDTIIIWINRIIDHPIIITVERSVTDLIDIWRIIAITVRIKEVWK